MVVRPEKYDGGGWGNCGGTESASKQRTTKSTSHTGNSRGNNLQDWVWVAKETLPNVREKKRRGVWHAE